MPRPLGHGPGYERRRQSIIDHAAVLFAEQGYSATGISDICARVELGKGALYYYIGSKENLLVEIQNRVLEPLLVETRRIEAIDTPATVRLRLLSEHLLTVILDRLDHIWVYEHDYRHLTGANQTKVLAQRREFERHVRSMIEEAMEAGAIDRTDARLATLQFLNLHNHTYQWARRTLPWAATDLSRSYYRTLMIGFGAAPAVVGDAERRILELAEENAS